MENACIKFNGVGRSGSLCFQCNLLITNRCNIKTIISGPRNFHDYRVVKEAIEASTFNITEIVSGGAKGVDALGEKYADEKGISKKKFKAPWKAIKNKPKKEIKENKYGKYWTRAGLYRNEKMASYADALVALKIGYEGSPGTNHMIQTAQKEGLEVYVHEVLPDKKSFWIDFWE